MIKFLVDLFYRWVDTDVLAAMSITLLYWFAISTVIMALLCWRQRYRFTHWFKVNARERADACLNLGWFLIFFNATWQRGQASYSFAVQEWKLSAVALFSAPFYLPWTMAGVSMFLWWACYEFFGARRRWWWCLWMWSGLGLYTIAVFVL